MSTHAQGRAALDAAWRTLFHAAPTRRELQIVGAVAALESGYGDGVYRRLSIPDGAVLEEFRGTNNWGAIQCCTPGPDGSCPRDTFPTTDRSPSKVTPQNPKGFYDACFRRFETPADGATGFLRALLVQKGREPVRVALASGSATTVARAMHVTHYEEAPVPLYALGIQRNAAAIAASLAEPLEVHLQEFGPVVTVPVGLPPTPAPAANPSKDGGDIATPLFIAGMMWYLANRKPGVLYGPKHL